MKTELKPTSSIGMAAMGISNLLAGWHTRAKMMASGNGEQNERIANGDHP